MGTPNRFTVMLGGVLVATAWSLHAANEKHTASVLQQADRFMPRGMQATPLRKPAIGMAHLTLKRPATFNAPLLTVLKLSRLTVRSVSGERRARSAYYFNKNTYQNRLPIDTSG